MQETLSSLWRKDPLQTRRYSFEDLETRFRSELDEAVRRTNQEITDALSKTPVLTVEVRRERAA